MTEANQERAARKMFEDFHDKPSRRRIRFNFGWPKVYQEIGVAQAQMYRSNKWKSNPREFEDYKHIAEAPQRCFVTRGFLRDYRTNKSLDVTGDEVEFEGPMPEYISVLAPLIGIQVQLFDERGKLSKDKGLYEVTVPHGMLGGARFPDTDEAFLVVYTKSEGVGMIITGDKLGVERDGIVG